MITTDDFKRGAAWGRLAATIYEDDKESDGARVAALEAVVDHLEQHPDRATMDALLEGWFGYKCHGRLASGEVCQRCGIVNPGEPEN